MDIKVEEFKHIEIEHTLPSGEIIKLMSEPKANYIVLSDETECLCDFYDEDITTLIEILEAYIKAKGIKRPDAI
jgi:hypothetical protein